jgi:hypothetical protein
MKGFFGAMGGRELALEDGESGVREGPANLWRGIESVGGWLWLTDRRLVFRSHAIALRSGETVWPISEIAKAEPAMSMWIIPNGLRLTLRDGSTAKLVVTGRQEWAIAIDAARDAAARR